MKTNKIVAIIVIVVMLALMLTACGQLFNRVTKDDLIGTWACTSGNTTIMYIFEKKDGVYSGVVTTSKGLSTPQIYLFDSYEVDGNVLNLYQDGKKLSYVFELDGDQLTIDGIVLTKF